MLSFERRISQPTSLRTSAGARLIVILFPYGHRNALLQIAEVTRSLLSLTACPAIRQPRSYRSFPIRRGLRSPPQTPQPRDRSRINLRRHNKTGCCFTIKTFARNVFESNPFSIIKLKAHFKPSRFALAAALRKLDLGARQSFLPSVFRRRFGEGIYQRIFGRLELKDHTVTGFHM
jgi:hypothetical protein